MPDIEAWVVWGIMIIVFGIIEAATAGIVAVWFMGGALLTMVCALLGVPVPGQIVVFVLVSVVLLVATRPVIKKYTKNDGEPLNADRCIGQLGIVVDTIDNMEAKGQVKTGGVLWSARSLSGEIIEEGETVIIQKIEGVKVFVTKN